MALIKLPQDTTTSAWLAFVKEYITLSNGGEYGLSHARRYAETILRIPFAAREGARALEIGSTSLFQEILRHFCRYAEVHGTDFETVPANKAYTKEISFLSEVDTTYLMHYVNIEDDKWPFDEGYFDFLMLCEVIEHMEVDPMYVLTEANRVLVPGGQILLTTPNSASARIVQSILDGYRPHFYMQYNRTRSLYRHNFEHDVHTITALLNGAGFRIEKLFTVDCFNVPVPESIANLKRLGKPTTNRGDNIIAVARKVGPPMERYPKEVYV